MFNNVYNCTCTIHEEITHKHTAIRKRLHIRTIMYIHVSVMTN